MAFVKLLDPLDEKNRLDRYELIGEIAAGGMAVVYLARIGGLGGFQRFVAIKRLHTHLAQEQEFVEMFLDEARLAAGIHNPHVVPILEVGGSGEAGYYLVMEYIEGDTLARVAARAAGRTTGLHPAAGGSSAVSGSGPSLPVPGAPPKRPKRAPASMPSAGPAIPRPVTVRILLDSLAGLHAAHELTDPHGRPLQIVHRDISPQNILVGVDGSARIADFGVARAAARLGTTRTDTVKGKLAYLSPEQARGEVVDRRTDLFAMGILLWEMLTGRRLFRGETDHETLARVMSGTIPAPSSLVPGMHAAFDAVALKALSRDVEQRFTSCAEMGDALERAALDALAAGAEGGVGSPRDVAAFMNNVLGQEIAAQRESVRVWLSQRNDPSLASSRPAPPVRHAPLATGLQPVVPPVPAPPRPAGMTSKPSTHEPFTPIVSMPHPEDGDPTTLRMVSSLTTGSMSLRTEDGSEPPPFARRSKARVAAVVGVAALLAVGVVVALKSGDGSRGAPIAASTGAVATVGTAPLPVKTAEPVAQPTVQVTAQATAQATGPAPATASAAAPTESPTAEPAPSDSPTAEPSIATAEGSPKPWRGNKKTPPPTTGAASVAPTTPPPAVTTPTPAKPPPGDDFGNPYK